MRRARAGSLLHKENQLKSLVNQLSKYTAFKGRASRTECWSVVPFLGLVVHFAVFFYPGDPEPNKYGCPSGHTGQD